MKRINTVFTTINILAVLGMLIHMGILYHNVKTVSAPRAIVFTGALVYVLPLLLFNLIWAVIQDKKGKQADANNVPVRGAARSRLVNIVFIALNIAVVAIMAIHNGFDIRSGGNSYFKNLIGWIWVLYIIPLIVINDAWAVVSMNMKDRLEVSKN